MAKLPRPDLTQIVLVEPEFVERTEPLWRIHPAVGEHRLAWNALRTFGPLRTGRFDPWPPPPGPRVIGVGYFGFDWATCLAEVFQVRRQVDLTQPGSHISAFRPTHPLRLLDLRGHYPIKVGASHKINNGPKNMCREWAIAFNAAFPDLEGMIFTGIAGTDCVVLYDPAKDTFGSAPLFSKTLDDPVIRDRVAQAAASINFQVLA